MKRFRVLAVLIAFVLTSTLSFASCLPDVRDVAKKVLPAVVNISTTQVVKYQNPFNGFEFDLEILYRAHQANMRISEIGVLWQDCSGSKVAPIRDGFKMLKAMLLIRYADLPFLYFRKLANQTRSQ